MREEYAATGDILKGITDHGSEFYATRRSKDDNPDYSFENYLAEYGIKHTLGVIDPPQSNGKIERFFQTYDKQRWRFASLDAFVDYYNYQRPHQNLRSDELERPAKAFDRLLPTAEDAAQLAVANGGEHATK